MHWRSKRPIIYIHTLKNTCSGSVDTSVAYIPANGSVSAGWVIMFSGNQGAEMGGGTAEGLSKNY